MGIKVRYIIFSVALILLISSCRNSGNGVSVPDISKINISLKMHRFEQDLFADTLITSDQYEELQQRYPDFLRCYYENIMQLGEWDSGADASLAKLQGLIRYGGIRAASDSVQVAYPDLDYFTSDLEKLLKYYRYYRPDDSIPAFTTFVSEYAYGIVDCGPTIGIGLDLYLGKSFSFYPSIGIPNYLNARMERDNILPGIAATLAERLIGTVANTNSLLSNMILNGKKLYFEDLLLPETTDYLKIGFTKNQEDWCKENEGEIWAFLNGEGMLFETSRMKFIKFISEAPSTPGLPPEAPGNIGSWGGWQIVRKYMKKTHSTLEELLKQADDQVILHESNYKPRRK